METPQNPDLPQRRVLIGRILGILIVLGAIVTGSMVWRINYRHPRTNDAMVRANIVGITAEVSGRITELHVEDNQFVRKGELLYVIDPRPYQPNWTGPKPNYCWRKKRSNRDGRPAARRKARSNACATNARRRRPRSNASPPRTSICTTVCRNWNRWPTNNT